MLALGSRLAHMALVAHELCAEHGAITHDHGAHAHEAPTSGPAVGQDAAAHDDVHDHCDVLATGATVVAPPALPAPALLSLLLPVTAGPRDGVRGDRLWLLAPKTSPPA
jgi:hypothetical protein